MPGPWGSASTAASACSGRRAVRAPTRQSYCSKSGRRDAMFGEASSAVSVSRSEPPGASVATGAGYSGADGASGARS